MKKTVIDRDSWHYKFNELCWDIKQGETQYPIPFEDTGVKNVCQYWSTTVFNILNVSINLMLLICLAVLVVVTVAYLVFLMVTDVSNIFIVVVLCLMMLLAFVFGFGIGTLILKLVDYIICGIVHFKKSRDTTESDTTESDDTSQPSLIMARYKDLKDKTCTSIEFK